jgi:thiamine biosynthesis lipoprotein
VHPRQINESIATVQLQGGAITSSGDYERFMMVDGHRYHHILNPKTGFPELEGFASVSVIAEKCLLAGSISTIAMLKGKYAKQWLDDMALPFLAVSSNLKLFGSIEV